MTPSVTDREQLPHCARCRLPPVEGAVDGLCLRCLLTGALVSLDDGAVLAAEADLSSTLLMDRELAGYRLIEEVGRGGMGIVFKARQLSADRVVALKVIAAGELASPRAVERFHNEARAVARLGHPHIVPIHEVGVDRGWHYFSMPLIAGRTLAAMIRKDPPEPEKSVRLLLKLARAVEHAHRRGILHRDLKPTNVLVDEAGEPHLTDFGLAKAVEAESDITLSQAVLGSPAYMSPEQAAGRGRDITTATDVYGLGAVFYELLSGRPPFTADSTPALLRKITEEDPPRIISHEWVPEGERGSGKRHADRNAKIANRVPLDVEMICLKCLEKEPAKRYATPGALAEDLERWLRQEPVLARRAGMMERTVKWVRRHRARAAVLVTVAGSLGLLVLGAVVFTMRLGRARDVAEAQTYAADINLAQQMLAANNIGRAAGLLDQYLPEPGGRDLRGWEWRYLRQHAHSQAQSVLATLSNAVTSLDVSRDGRWVAASEAEGGSSSLFDLQTGRRVLRGNRSLSRGCVAFSPVDGTLAFSETVGESISNRLHKVLLFDPAGWKPAGEFTVPGVPLCLKFSHDGRILLVAAAAPESGVFLWDVALRRQVASFPASRLTDGAAEASADLRLWAESTDGGRLRVRNLETGATLWEKEAAEDLVKAAAFSPDNRLIASAGAFAETGIRLWDAATGAESGRLSGHGGYVHALRFLGDGRTLVSAASDQTLRVWDVVTKRTLVVLRGHRQEVWRLAMLPDGRTLVSGAKDGTLLTWDIDRARFRREVLTLPVPIVDWAFGPDGRTVIAMEREGAVSAWSGADFQDRRLLHDFGAEIRQAAFSDDSRRVAVQPEGGENRVWDLDGPREISAFKLSGTARPLRFSRDGARLFLEAWGDGDLNEWNLDAGGRPGTSLKVAGPPLFNGAVSPDGRWRVAGNQLGKGWVIDIATGGARPLDLKIEQAAAAHFSPDGRLLAITSLLGYVRLWEWPSLREAGTLRGFLQGAHGLAFSPDGRRLAAGSSGREAVKLWDLSTRRELVTLEGQGSIFSRVRFSPDGDVISARSSAGALHLWRAPSQGETGPGAGEVAR